MFFLHLLIYIPIWYYLNMIIEGTVNEVGQIYIPIWYYLNDDSLLEAYINELFTFQYGTT